MVQQERHPHGREPEPPARSENDRRTRLSARRAIRLVIRSFLRRLLGPASRTPLVEAQELVNRAFEEPDRSQRTGLAKQALALSPDCADAYVLLAAHARTRKEALGLYQHAVAAAERAIGPEVFREAAGRFGGRWETRSYLRARKGLALTLWALSRREEAAEHLRDMLRLDPGDNQGVRDTLVCWLLDLGRDEELAWLLERYDAGTATWAYTRVLLTFRQQGDTPEARTRLEVARKANKHVPAYLLGEKPIPAKRPSRGRRGRESEAIIYTRGAMSGWRFSPGALAWLREATRRQGTASGTGQKPPAAGPSAIDKARLGRLPRPSVIWQAARRPLAILVEEEGRLVQPWAILVASRSDDLILAQTITREPPSAARAWDVLAEAMSHPMMGRPHRPTRVQVRADPIWDDLRPHLEEIGVDCVEADELDLIDSLVEESLKELRKDWRPGLLDMPGVTPERVGVFYRAAAEFYRRAPWRALGDEEAIRVESDRHESGPWYAVVMGRSGLPVGVSLHEELELLRQIWARDFSDEENARRIIALGVMFVPESQVPMADLLAGREHDWEVAGPEAYPWVVRKEPGLSTRPPLDWELELLEGCLRAIPGFIAEHRPGETAPHRKERPVALGEWTPVLSWVEEG